MAPKKQLHTAPKARSHTPSTSSTSSQCTTSPPNWPVFHPLIPPSDLSLTTLLPSQILLIHHFWTASLCKKYISFLKTLPLQTTPGKPKRGDAVRVNDRFQVDDGAFAERLWRETGLKEVILREGRGEGGDGDEGMTGEERESLWGGEVIGLNPSIRIYRYTKGQFFDRHYDESNNVTLAHPSDPTPAKTTWTLLLYLTSRATGCHGGETVFYPDAPAHAGNRESIVVDLEAGMVLLHRHGADCMLHEGREVTEGEKWVIRTDLCVRRRKEMG